MISVFIVDDSVTTCEYLRAILEDDTEVTIAGIANDGSRALEEIVRLRPDVVLMDINMPGMNGYVATEKILAQYPVPIIICSTLWKPGEIAKTFQAIEVGAVTALAKPPGPGHPDFTRLVKRFVNIVKAMSEVTVIARKYGNVSVSAAKKNILKRVSITKNKIVAMGASTGGPQVLLQILKQLPDSFPLPIVIVQHIADGFLEGMGIWLENNIALKIVIPKNGERLLSGRVYLAPDGGQMSVNNNRIQLHPDAPKENQLAPSVSFLFRSIAESYGTAGIAILLTGMGRDGAQELKSIRDNGGLTIAQDAESSAIHGMPGEAIRLDGASHIMAPEQIAELLNELVSVKQ